MRILVVNDVYIKRYFLIKTDTQLELASKQILQERIINKKYNKLKEAAAQEAINNGLAFKFLTDNPDRYETISIKNIIVLDDE